MIIIATETNFLKTIIIITGIISEKSESLHVLNMRLTRNALWLPCWSVATRRLENGAEDQKGRQKTISDDNNNRKTNGRGVWIRSDVHSPGRSSTIAIRTTMQEQQTQLKHSEQDTGTDRDDDNARCRGVKHRQKQRYKQIGRRR